MHENSGAAFGVARYGFAFAVAVSAAIAVCVAGKIPGGPLRVGGIIVVGEMVGGKFVGVLVGAGVGV